ncbi:hypothetical protein B0H13DRAFT_528100 [Mycena leptocephala]|nr:hypothetical protein B0H13DRAFT_528100 [Mycena leptocephala]
MKLHGDLVLDFGEWMENVRSKNCNLQGNRWVRMEVNRKRLERGGIVPNSGGGTDDMYDTHLSYVNSVTVRLPSGGVRTRLNICTASAKMNQYSGGRTMLPHIQTPEAQSTVARMSTARVLVKDAGDRDTAHLGSSSEEGNLYLHNLSIADYICCEMKLSAIFRRVHPI